MILSTGEAEALLLANQNLPFVELVARVGLDPARHFRYADLTDVDFSGQDLGAFDFTGSLLLGCTFDRSTLGKVILTGARYDKTALYMAADFDAAFGFADTAMDRELFHGYAEQRRWTKGLGRRLIQTSGLISAVAVLRRYLEKSRDIAAAQVEELADAMAPEDAFYLAESAAGRIRQDLIRWGSAHCKSLDRAADRFQKLVVPPKESTRVYLDNLFSVASAIEFFGVLAIAGRLGVATNAVRSHEFLARLDGPKWNSPPLAQADWTWMLGQYRKASGANAPLRCDDLLPLLQTATSTSDVLEVFSLMSRHGLRPTMAVLRAASLAVPAAGPSSVAALLSTGGIESGLMSLKGLANTDEHADRITGHFARFLEPSEFYRQGGTKA